MLIIGLRPSMVLAGLLCSMHVLALLAVWLTKLPFYVVVSSTLALAFSLMYSLSRQFGRRAIKQIRLDEPCRVSILAQQNLWQETDLLPTSFVSPYLTVLNLRTPQRNTLQHVVIFPDGVDEEQFRQLRVWLRWRCTKKNGPGVT